MANDVSTLNPAVRQAYEWCAAWMKHLTGIDPTLTSAYRSGEEQTALYEGRANNPYPVNRPGDSAHGVRRSLLGPGALGLDSWVPDKTVIIQGQAFNSWEVWTYLRTAIGFRVPSNDRVHSEVPNWRNYRPEFD